jgi:hypothetical protein
MRGSLFNTEHGQLEGLAGYGGSYTLPPPFQVPNDDICLNFHDLNFSMPHAVQICKLAVSIPERSRRLEDRPWSAPCLQLNWHREGRGGGVGERSAP